MKALKFLVVFLAFYSQVAIAGPITKKYRITGNSTGSEWSWQIYFSDPDRPLLVSRELLAPSVPAGQPCDSLAKKFADDIRSVYFGVRDTAYINIESVQVDPADPCCFTITVFNGGQADFGLCVGPVGNPSNCCVTVAGCNFNPTIVEVPLSLASPVPTLPTYAFIILIFLLTGTAVWVLKRRMVAEKGGTG